ncbi:MAG: hypothetical protein AB7S93_05835 [Xanthobacteraceae bacterium]
MLILPRRYSCIACATISISGGVSRLFMHEPLTDLRKVIVIQRPTRAEADVWRALCAASSFFSAVGKLPRNWNHEWPFIKFLA